MLAGLHFHMSRLADPLSGSVRGTNGECQREYMVDWVRLPNSGSRGLEELSLLFVTVRRPGEPLARIAR